MKPKYAQQKELLEKMQNKQKPTQSLTKTTENPEL